MDQTEDGPMVFDDTAKLSGSTDSSGYLSITSCSDCSTDDNVEFLDWPLWKKGACSFSTKWPLSLYPKFNIWSPTLDDEAILHNFPDYEPCTSKVNESSLVEDVWGVFKFWNALPSPEEAEEMKRRKDEEREALQAESLARKMQKRQDQKQKVYQRKVLHKRKMFRLRNYYFQTSL